MGRTFDPEAIEELGRGPLTDLAGSYDDIASRLTFAAAERDSCFQDGSVAASWNDLFGLFKDAVSESALNLRSLAGAMIEAAEEQRGDEDRTEQQMRAIVEDITEAYDQALTSDDLAASPESSTQR